MRNAARVWGAGVGMAAAVAVGCSASSRAQRLDRGDASLSLDVAADILSGGDALDAGDALGFPRALFNGIDFTGWDRYLGTPAPGADPVGLNNDPQGVFSVVAVDGEPAIRISGQTFGALTSQQELCDFHLSLEYRWGTQVWPPSPGFDSGVMYLSTGPFGAVNAGGPTLSNPIGSGGFMVSVEYQLIVADAGGMVSLGPITFTAGPHPLSPSVPDAWNHVEIIVRGGVATHRLNGQDVATGMGFEVAWPGETAQPLTCGKLQLQSEGSEIFFRRVQLLAPGS